MRLSCKQKTQEIYRNPICAEAQLPSADQEQALFQAWQTTAVELAVSSLKYLGKVRTYEDWEVWTALLGNSLAIL